MTTKRLYIQQKQVGEVPKCTHGTKLGTKFYLDTKYSQKYNNCMFCAIEAWGGSMPHAEIAACLGIDRMRVCQLEKIVLEKLKKKINFRNKRVLREIDFVLIDVKGLANKFEINSIKEITSKISEDFDIENPVKIIILNKELSLSSKLGQAMYEKKNSYHEIKIDKTKIKSKRELINTLIHEMFHAAQAENNKQLSDSLCEAVVSEFSNKYYRKFLDIQSKNRKLKLLGKRR
jgi:hypothetical protein